MSSPTCIRLKSLAAHHFWIDCGRPRQGDVFMEMKRAKIEYKQAIRVHKHNSDMCISNELHDLSLSKDVNEFWNTWNTKLGRSIRRH